MVILNSCRGFWRTYELPYIINANAVIYFSLSIVTMDLPSMWDTSPIQCHTVKEYQEKLDKLKKENFKLKRRISFLEERMGYMYATDDKDDPVKKNIELRVKCSFSSKCALYRSMQLV
jgi:hypothetical protein